MFATGRSSVPAAEAAGWLAVAAAHTALNHIRSGRRRAFSEAFEGHPFLSAAAITPTYLGWAGLWVVLILGLAGLAFQRRDV